MSNLLNQEQIIRMTAWKLTGQMSCARCKFLYLHDTGYSNWTVENTTVLCALDKNPHLGADGLDLPHNWHYSADKDNWPATRDSRCERYEGSDSHVQLDVDGENFPDEFHVDAEAIAAIEAHSGRKRGT